MWLWFGSWITCGRALGALQRGDQLFALCEQVRGFKLAIGNEKRNLGT